jgi:hypothetical protein
MPILRYTRGDAEGDANSFHSLTPELSSKYNIQALVSTG